VADRTPTAQGATIPDPPGGADPQRAIASCPADPSRIIRNVPKAGGAAVATVAMTPLDLDATAHDAALIGESPSGSGSPKRVTIRANEATADPPSRARPVLDRARMAVLQGTRVDSVIEGLDPAA
jgi:hypothetical protein